jgi:hypothetical protein
MVIERVGDFSLGWGESLVWDDRAARSGSTSYVVSVGTAGSDEHLTAHCSS